MEAVATTLLERETEVAAVGGFVDEAAVGPAVLVVEGEPGIGKTELWSTGVALARTRGLRVLESRPAGAETQLSFAVLRDLLGTGFDEAVVSLPDPQRRALEVALLFEEAGGAGPDAHTIAAATLGALRSLAGSEPLLVAIDDAQWIDGASAAALGFAVRRLDESPVSFLVGRRPDEARPETRPFDDAVAGRATPVRLGPLGATSIRRLVRDRLGASFPQRVFERLYATSGGNPFYALELGRALGRRSDSIDPYGELPVPQTLQGLVQERLDAQPAEVRDVLAVMAALADPTLSLVEATAPADAIDDAVHAGLVLAEGDRLRFTHPLLASAAYGLLGPSARRDLHRRLAAVVSDCEERARHLSLAADGPSAEVAAALHEAARGAAARGAIGTAAELADRAVRLTPPELADLLALRRHDAASYQVRHGDASRARTHLEVLIALEPSDALRSAALLRLARLSEEDPAGSLQTCEQVIAESTDDVLSAEAQQLAAEMAMLSGNVAGALEHARAAVALAERAGDDAILVESLGTLCHYETYMGSITPGLLERAVELEANVVRPSNNYSPREILGLRLMYSDRLDEARGLLEASLLAATELGDELDRMSILVHLTQLECRAGDLVRAREHAHEADLLQSQLGGWARSAGAFVFGLGAAHVGRVDEARAAAERGAAESERGLFQVLGQWVAGFLELSLGDAAGANRLLHDLPDRLEQMGYVNPGVRPVYADAIEARIAAGDLDVEPLVDRLATRGEELDYPWAQATAARCRGLLLAARGDVDGATAALEVALLHHDRCPQPLERGRSLLALGTLQRRAKRRGDARETLRESLELFDALGAALWAEKAASELARIPGRGRGSGELTATERRVAELVTEGRSNREIAATMFVSVRTVEGNLSRVYAKLGLRSRTELARHFANADL